MMTDTIADMLTRIRNAQMASRHQARMPFSKVKLAVAEILCREGYLNKVEKIDGSPIVLSVDLKYDGKMPAIQSIKRESKPGHRMYRNADELPTVINGYGIAIVSTSQGMMTSKEAKKLGIGGEVICSVF